MATEAHLGLIKRFGARYGRKLREKVAEIDHESRRKHVCPYCSRIAVKRVAAGIWECRKCNKKFTGRAYTISKKILVTEEIAQDEMPTLLMEEPVSKDETEEEEETA